MQWDLSKKEILKKNQVVKHTVIVYRTDFTQDRRAKKLSHSRRIPGSKLNGFKSEVPDYFHNKLFMKLSGSLWVNWLLLSIWTRLNEFQKTKKGESIFKGKNWIIRAKNMLAWLKQIVREIKAKMICKILTDNTMDIKPTWFFKL